MRRISEKVNIAIRDNEVSAMDWELSNLASELYWWVDAFNVLFFKGQPVPVPAISFERARVTSLGHYVVGRNSFGIRENINLNRRYLNRPLWDILATLFHEMLHSWQAMYGKPSRSWFHNKEFQEKAKECGIIVNSKGQHVKLTDPFLFHLKRLGVDTTEVVSSDGNPAPILPPKPKGKSKLKKWQCPCGQAARVGRQEFHARCTLCGKAFILV